MKKTASILIVIAVITLLTGCTSNFKVNEDAVKQASDKITEAIIDNVGKEEAENQESYTINAKDVSTLNIKSSVGSINITSHESEDAVVKINIVASSSTKEKSEKLIKNFTYTAEKNINSIDIDTSQRVENIGEGNIKTNLDIYVPSNIKNVVISSNVSDINIKKVNGKFEVACNVSNINIENSEGIYNLKTDVGKIVLKESAASGKSEFIVNTGDINLSLKDITNADFLTASTAIGGIKMSLPENSSYEAFINEFMKDEKIQTNGEQKTKINLKTNVGSITLN